MTREEFDNCVLYVEQDTGIIADAEEAEQFWQLWKNHNAVFVKRIMKVGLILWHYEKLEKAGRQKHTDN